MNSLRKIITISVLILSLTGISFAQFFSEAMSVEALRPFWNVSGLGASSFSLLNNSLLAGDISSTQSNPAFLINTQRPKASLVANNIFNSNHSYLNGNVPGNISKSSAIKADYFGFAYPVPVYQGSMVLAVSYEPSGYYYSSLKSHGNIAIANYGTVAERIETDESGSINTLKFSGAVEFLPDFNVGLSLNFVSGERSYSSVQYENADLVDTENDDYPDITYTETIKPEYDGFNMDLGIVYQTEQFKFHMRLSTPLTLHIHELSEFRIQNYYDEAGSTGLSTDTTEYYNITYTSKYPWEIAPGIALKLGGITLGADLIVHNWPDIEADQVDNAEEINRDLQWNLRRTTDISLSAAIPIGRAISTRFAYRRVQSPYENLQNEEDEIIHIFGGSVETILMKSLILGCSYQQATGNQTIPHPYYGTYSTQSFNDNRLSLSLAILL